MLRMERKSSDGKQTYVFRRLFDDAPDIAAVVEEDDAVEILALLLTDLSDFHLAEFLRKLSEKERVRIWGQLQWAHEYEMPELGDIR
jgi:hypothetical protein